MICITWDSSGNFFFFSEMEFRTDNLVVIRIGKNSNMFSGGTSVLHCSLTPPAVSAAGCGEKNTTAKLF